MMELIKAKDIASKEFPDYPIASVIDIGKAWAFDFDTGNPAIPGIPFVCVNKQNGKVDYLSVPPLENLDIINNGIAVKM